MKKIRLGILGCGMIGQSFMKNALLNSSYEIRGFYDRNSTSGQAAKTIAPDAAILSSEEELINSSEIDAILICTRHSDHARQAAHALAQGKHVLIEKPIATTLEDLHLLLKAQRDNPYSIATALPHGEEPLLDEVKQWIQEPYLGKIVAFHSYLDVPGPPRSNWYYSSAAIGGASLDTLPYALIRLLMLTQNDIRYAVGFKNQLIKKRLCLDGNKVESTVDDNATLILEFYYGQQAIIRSSWNISCPEDYLVIRGRQGDLWVDFWKNTILLISEKPPSRDYVEVQWQTKKAYQWNLPILNPEEIKLNVFLKHIREGKGNLLKIAYGMEILLKCLFTDKNSYLMDPFHKVTDHSLALGETYI